MRPRLLLLFLAGLTIASCVPRALPPEDFSGGVLTVGCCGHADEVIELAYLGAGGVMIRKGESEQRT